MEQLLKTKGLPVSREPVKIEFPGDVLLSHAVTREVPSGLKGLTAVFGMGTGVAPSLKPPGKLVLQKIRQEPVVPVTPGVTGDRKVPCQARES